MKYGILSWPLGLSKLILFFFLQDCYSRERNQFQWFFSKSIFKIGLRLDVYKPIYFKVGMMVVITMLYSFILINVKNTLTFTQGHRVLRKLELLQLCWKVAWSRPNIYSGWLWREMTAKSSVRKVNMDHLSICSFFWVFFFSHDPAKIHQVSLLKQNVVNSVLLAYREVEDIENFGANMPLCRDSEVFAIFSFSTVNDVTLHT